MHSLMDPQLDRDHDFLINRFSDLYGTLCWEPGQAEANLSLLEELGAHVMDHFQREELLMARAGFPGITRHRQAHQALRRAFRQGLRSLEHPRHSHRTFLLQMRERFLAHIVTWDEAFGEWLSFHPQP